MVLNLFLFPRISINKSKFLKRNFPNAKIKYRRLGNILINDVILIKPNDSVNFVLKKYNSFTNLVKWTCLKAITFYGCNYYVSDYHRKLNELNGLRWSEKVGNSFEIHAPKVKDQINGGLLIEYIDGIPIDQFTKFSPKQFFTHFKRIASILYEVHNNNYSFGDCKAENIFFNQKENKYYFLDFEQFEKVSTNEFGRKIWDLTEIFYYLGHIFPSKKSQNFFKKLIFTFLTSYYECLFENHPSTTFKRKMFDELGKLRYTIIYSTFMTPQTFLFVRKTINEWKQQFKHKWNKQYA